MLILGASPILNNKRLKKLKEKLFLDNQDVESIKHHSSYSKKKNKTPSFIKKNTMFNVDDLFGIMEVGSFFNIVLCKNSTL